MGRKITIVEYSCNQCKFKTTKQIKKIIHEKQSGHRMIPKRSHKTYVKNYSDRKTGV
jgi:hypothetical protein